MQTNDRNTPECSILTINNNNRMPENNKLIREPKYGS